MRSCISVCFDGIEGILHHEYVLRCCASTSLLRGRPQSNAERASGGSAMYCYVAVSFGLWGLGPIFLQSHCRPGVGRLLGIQRGAGGAVVGGAAAAAAAGWHLGGDRGQPLRRRCLFFFSTLPERATNT